MCVSVVTVTSQHVDDYIRRLLWRTKQNKKKTEFWVSTLLSKTPGLFWAGCDYFILLFMCSPLHERQLKSQLVSDLFFLSSHFSSFFYTLTNPLLLFSQTAIVCWHISWCTIIGGLQPHASFSFVCKVFSQICPKIIWKIYIFILIMTIQEACFSCISVLMSINCLWQKKMLKIKEANVLIGFC